MEYKGYVARVEFDEGADVFHGQVVNLRDVITFEGESVTELRKAFQDSVDDYLEFCASRNEDPEKPFSGKFLVRVDPDLHRKAALAAGRVGESLNTWITKAIERTLEHSTITPQLGADFVRAFRTVLHRETRVWLREPEKVQHRLVFQRGFGATSPLTRSWADDLISSTGSDYERFTS